MPLQIRYPSIAVGDDKDYSSLASQFQWDPFESQNDETRVALLVSIFNIHITKWIVIGVAHADVTCRPDYASSVQGYVRFIQ
jgi:hypothetical protein